MGPQQQRQAAQAPPQLQGPRTYAAPILRHSSGPWCMWRRLDAKRLAETGALEACSSLCFCCPDTVFMVGICMAAMVFICEGVHGIRTWVTESASKTPRSHFSLLYTRSNSTDYNALQSSYAKIPFVLLISRVSLCRDATSVEMDELRKPDNRRERADFWRTHLPRNGQTTGHLALANSLLVYNISLCSQAGGFRFRKKAVLPLIPSSDWLPRGAAHRLSRSAVTSLATSSPTTSVSRLPLLRRCSGRIHEQVRLDESHQTPPL